MPRRDKISTPNEKGAAKRGPRAERGEAAEQIVRAAREAFAEDGFAGTTLRAIGNRADVDPALVTYYFGDKRGLLEACLVPPSSLVVAIGEAIAAPLNRRGRALADAMLGQWDDPEAGVVLRSIIMTAAHEPLALDRLRTIFTDVILLGVAEGLPEQERMVRAGLVASQLAGVAMVRYVWRVGALAGEPTELVARHLAPTLQRYLTGKI